MNIDLTTILVIAGAIIAGVVLSRFAGKVEIERWPPQWRGLIL
jgi:hypothetical protein